MGAKLPVIQWQTAAALPEKPGAPIRQKQKRRSGVPERPLVTHDTPNIEPGPTPIPISPRGRTIAVLGATIAVVLFLRAAPDVVTVLVGGATLALVLSFPVRLLARIVPSKVAITLVLLVLLLGIVASLIGLVPVVVEQLTGMISVAPELGARSEQLLRDLLQPLREGGFLQTSPDEVIDTVERSLIARGQALGQAALAGILGTLTGAVGTFLQLFGILFVAVYLLADLGRFRGTYLRLAPAPYRGDADDLWEALGHSLSRYLGGLAVSLAVQGVMAWLGLTLLGVPFAILLGLWTAATGILPYVGAFLGAIPALIVALTVSLPTALLTALLFLAVNQVEGNFLTPRIQGRAINVHPLLVFVGVVAGAQIAGLIGAVLVVPLLGVLRVLLDFLAARVYVRRPGARAESPVGRPFGVTAVGASEPVVIGGTGRGGGGVGDGAGAEGGGDLLEQWQGQHESSQASGAEPGAGDLRHG